MTRSPQGAHGITYLPNQNASLYYVRVLSSPNKYSESGAEQLPWKKLFLRGPNTKKFAAGYFSLALFERIACIFNIYIRKIFFFLLRIYVYIYIYIYMYMYFYLYILYMYINDTTWLST